MTVPSSVQRQSSQTSFCILLVESSVPLLTWVSHWHMCTEMLVYNNAKPTIRHYGVIKKQTNSRGGVQIWWCNQSQERSCHSMYKRRGISTFRCMYVTPYLNEAHSQDTAVHVKETLYHIWLPVAVACASPQQERGLLRWVTLNFLLSVRVKKKKQVFLPMDGLWFRSSDSCRPFATAQRPWVRHPQCAH